ncbi:MAG: molybdate ABC transporter substrate-binding protein [Nitrospiraceae bacterium]
MKRQLHLAVACVAVFLVITVGGLLSAAEPLVIAASPSLKVPLEALGRAFEEKNPEMKIQLYFDSGLDLRRTIAGMENSMVGQYFIGRGPIHLVAPGGDELIARLQQKYYVLPGTRRAYAREQLVLVVPESLVDAPGSFDELKQGVIKRLAVADPQRTTLGKQTQDALRAFGLTDTFKGRLDVATDSRGVLDHLLSGQADAGIIFGHDAVRERERVRVVAVADKGYDPTVHSMAMERYCPNRKLCTDFLEFIQTEEAQRILRGHGYSAPKNLTQ